MRECFCAPHTCDQCNDDDDVDDCDVNNDNDNDDDDDGDDNDDDYDQTHPPSLTSYDHVMTPMQTGCFRAKHTRDNVVTLVLHLITILFPAYSQFFF